MSKTCRIGVQPGDAYLIPGDLHYPLQNDGAVNAMWEWFQNRTDAGCWLRTGLLLQGDTLDCYGLSRFGKRAKKFWDAGRLMYGVNSARPLIEWGARMPLGATMILGNHDLWASSFVNDNPALDGCPGVAFGSLTGLSDIDGLEILGHGDKVLLGDKVVVCHGDTLGAKTPASIVAKYPDQTTVLGHYHRVWSQLRTVYGPDGEAGYRGAHCVGMLASSRATEDYAPDGDMQLGFGVVEFFGPLRTNGQPHFRVDLHTIVKAGHDYVVC